MAKTKIHGEYLDPSVISAQTEVTAVGSDHMLIFDATDNALKKALLSDLIETVGSTPTFTSAIFTKTGTNASPHIKLTESGDTREFNIYNDGSGNGRLVLADTDDTPDTEIVLADNGVLQFKTANSLAMTIDSSQRVGIGCTPTSYATEIQATTGGNGLKIRGRSAGGNEGWLAWTDNADNVEAAMYATADNLIFANTTSYTERMRIDSSGNVGIGTSSPGHPLNVVDSGELQAEFSGYSHASAANNSRAASGSIRLGNGAGTTGLLLDYTDQGQTVGLIKNEYVASSSSELRLQSPFLSFYTGTSAAEKMRIDSSGNLLIGKNTGASSVAGHRFNPNGSQESTASGTQPLYLNRLSSNGNIIVFDKDNTTVGSIGSEGNDALYIQSGTTSGSGLHFHPTSGLVRPVRNGVTVDGVITLGQSARRFNNLYLAGGVYLGGTGSANQLDDYEEGTWTPTINSGTLSSGGGYYTKIGRVVTVSYYYDLTTLGSSTTPVVVGGLPFAAKTAGGNGHQTVGSVLCRFFSKNQIVSYVGDNSTTLLYYNNTSTDFDQITFGEIEVSYDNDFRAHGTHTYITS